MPRTTTSRRASLPRHAPITMADAGDDDGAMRTVINITAVVAIIALLMMAVWLCIRCKQAQRWGGTARPKKKGAACRAEERTHGSVVQPSAGDGPPIRW